MNGEEPMTDDERDPNEHEHTISVTHSHVHSGQTPHGHGVDTFAYEIPLSNTDSPSLDGWTVIIDPEPTDPEPVG